MYNSYCKIARENEDMATAVVMKPYYDMPTAVVMKPYYDKEFLYRGCGLLLYYRHIAADFVPRANLSGFLLAEVSD